MKTMGHHYHRYILDKLVIRQGDDRTQPRTNPEKEVQILELEEHLLLPGHQH